MYDKGEAYDYQSQAINSDWGSLPNCINTMKRRTCWLTTSLNHTGFIVIDDGANDKDAAEGATCLNRIDFIVINDRANEKDDAEGASWLNLIGFIGINDGANEKYATAGAY